MSIFVRVLQFALSLSKKIIDWKQREQNKTKQKTNKKKKKEEEEIKIKGGGEFIVICETVNYESLV